MMWAVRNEQIDIIEKLCSRGANVHQVDNVRLYIDCVRECIHQLTSLLSARKHCTLVGL